MSVNTGRFMSAIARWCFRHRFAVIAAWVLVLVGLGALSQAVKSDYNNSFSLPGTGSTTAQQLLAKAIPAQAGDSDTVVWHVSHGTVRDATVSTRMNSVLKQIATMPEVASVTSPYGPHGAAQISRDGRTAYATVDFARQANNLAKRTSPRRHRRRQGGPCARAAASSSAARPSSRPSRRRWASAASWSASLAAAVVLFLAFGSLLAMLLPIATALVGVGTGLHGDRPAQPRHRRRRLRADPRLPSSASASASTTPCSSSPGTAAACRPGCTAEEAAVKALNTSGRAVLFAGGTVCIALLGMLVLRLSFLNGVAIAAALTVRAHRARRGHPAARAARRPRHAGAAAAGSAAGWPPRARTRAHRGLRGRAGRRSSNGSPALLAAVGGRGHARPGDPGAARLRLGSSDQGNDPPSTTTRQAYDLLADGLRARLQRPAAAGRRRPARRRTRPPSTGCSTRCGTRPGVAAVSRAARSPPRPAPRSSSGRSRPPRPQDEGDHPTSSSTCATTSSRPPSAAPRCRSTSAA